MIDELLLQLEKNLSATDAFCLGVDRVIHRGERDHQVLLDGFFLFCGITSEVAYRVLTDVEFRSYRGRILKWTFSVGSKAEYILLTLDAFHDILITELSRESGCFKGSAILNGCAKVDTLSALWPVIAPVVRTLVKGLGGDSDAAIAKELFQLFSLLRKLAVDRSDLEPQMITGFLEREEILARETEYQRRKYPQYTSLIARVRRELMEVIQGFRLDYIHPKHGSGAVAQRGVKGPDQKEFWSAFVPTVDYMLCKTGLGCFYDYLGSKYPYKSQRQSRFICVPKTWKSLRGISAEPAELQYFQQGVREALERSIRLNMSESVTINSQEYSRQMTLQASRDGSYATIDLSEASDSVTVQLVRDIFGNSLLARWLIATRSKSTMLTDGTSVETNRFSPMGSAVCFPVECLIFAGISRAVVRSSNLHRDYKDHDTRVFGDDIIVPSECAFGVMEALHLCGFTVNSSKSFRVGYFRESCGEFAWKGFSITPFRFKKVEGGILSPSQSYKKCSQMATLCNHLEVRGYHRTRSYILARVVSSYIDVGSMRVSAIQQHLFTYHGGRNTIMSTHPTNFHVKHGCSRFLQTRAVRCVVWVPKAADIPNDSDSRRYREWLLSRQKANLDPKPKVYDLQFFKSVDEAEIEDCETTMVPSFVWKIEERATSVM